MRLLLPLLVVLAGLAGRALTDKLIALRGGPAAIGTWAQLSSLIDLVAGVSLAGVGVALVAAVAKSQAADRPAWLKATMIPCMVLSGLTALAAAPLMHWAGFLVVPAGQQSLALLALLAGWLAVPPGLAVSALIGAGRAGRAAALTAVSFLPPVSLLLVSPTGSAPADLLIGQILFGAAVAISIFLRRAGEVDRLELRRLLRFAPAGITIGLLSPIAMVLARARISEALSWEHVAMVQTVWRANEWTTAVVAGMLYVHYLPRLVAAGGRQAFSQVLGHAAALTLVPAALAMLGLWMLLPLVIEWLYRPELVPARTDAGLLLLGDFLRVVSWVFLYGLYARQAPRAVTIGEFLSIPLFALLLWLAVRPASLWDVGMAWTLAYLAYAVFNGLALRQALHESTAGLAPQRAL